MSNLKSAMRQSTEVSGNYIRNQVACRAAGVRKKFNRLNRHVSIGDVVKTSNGKFGEYQGISATDDPSRKKTLLTNCHAL